MEKGLAGRAAFGKRADSHTPSLRATPLGRGDSERRKRNPLWRGVPYWAGCVGADPVV